MEGLTAFVSRFDEEKPRNEPARGEDIAEEIQTDNMPSTSSSISLPFSIAEILSDKRSLSKPQRGIAAEDVRNQLNSYTFQGEKTDI